MGVALVPRDLDTLEHIGRIFASSGFYKGIDRASKAMVKVMLGRELGFAPAASMTDIHIVEGKPVLSGTMLAALVKRHPLYRYTIQKHDNEECVLEFFERDDRLTALSGYGEWRSLGVSSYSMSDARTAGLAHKDNWKKHPRNMLFARAMSNGVKWFCPDVFAGMSVYSEADDFDWQANADTFAHDGTVIDVDPETGEILKRADDAVEGEVVDGGNQTLSQDVRSAIHGHQLAVPHEHVSPTSPDGMSAEGCETCSADFVVACDLGTCSAQAARVVEGVPFCLWHAEDAEKAAQPEETQQPSDEPDQPKRDPKYDGEPATSEQIAAVTKAANLAKVELNKYVEEFGAMNTWTQPIAVEMLYRLNNHLKKAREDAKNGG